MQRKRNLWIVAWLLPLCVFLSACESHTRLEVNANDTYTIHTHFEQPRSSQDLKCEDQLPGLEQYSSAPTVKIEDKSSAERSICDVTVRDQHISKAKAPFVTIAHRGDNFQVRLKPIQLDFLDNSSGSFQLQIVFPGKVQQVESASPYTVSGNTVTWHEASVLVQGFQVEGRAHAGLTIAQRAWLVVAGLLVIGLVLLVVFRRRPPIARFWRKVKQLLQPVLKVGGRALQRLLTWLDLSYQRGDRDRKQGDKGRGRGPGRRSRH